MYDIGYTTLKVLINDVSLIDGNGVYIKSDNITYRDITFDRMSVHFKLSIDYYESNIRFISMVECMIESSRVQYCYIKIKNTSTIQRNPDYGEFHDCELVCI